jgi:NOL1/NOP2/fmu family ribosome biogenesis protein
LKAACLPESAVDFTILPEDYLTFLVGETWHTLTQQAFEVLHTLQPGVRIRQAGVALGTSARKGFVPHHALALSSLVSPPVPRFELPMQDALNYLRRLDIVLPQQPAGFAMMTFEELGLGWAKNLGSRVNNYYPLEWRIRK